jgi:hypothetical protein
MTVHRRYSWINLRVKINNFPTLDAT